MSVVLGHEKHNVIILEDRHREYNLTEVRPFVSMALNEAKNVLWQLK
jgi:hypothetical protein